MRPLSTVTKALVLLLVKVIKLTVKSVKCKSEHLNYYTRKLVLSIKWKHFCRQFVKCKDDSVIMMTNSSGQYTNQDKLTKTG